MLYFVAIRLAIFIYLKKSTFKGIDSAIRRRTGEIVAIMGGFPP